MLCTVSGRAATGASLPTPDSALVASETLAAGATSLASTVSAQPGMVWRLTVRGGDAWAAFAPAPDASAADRWLLPPGVWDFHATRAAEKVAVMAAD
ncbi:hypothetical protein [Phenylobacterium sp.]|jgi:hypothetical protein|uniref:hypothetical protein n=1 Tax=Phenylobacterium sp. TaxID=1871053 RepID=UPI0035B11688